jgi:hypothetical protein
MTTEIHDITVPYISRFVWASGIAKQLLEEKVNRAKVYLLTQFPKLIVDKDLARFAPIRDIQDQHYTLREGVILNHYFCRWNTMQHVMDAHPAFVAPLGIYGREPQISFEINERWDLMRDFYQLGLAPDCCREAYFKTQHRDPYHELYEQEPGKIKRIASGEMNSMLAPLGLFISPIVPCSLHCQAAHEKAILIGDTIKLDHPEVYETLKMIVEMPLRIDSYRGMALVDTPMFKGVFATDAYREKLVIDFKPNNPELFNYNHPWVASGKNFPFKGLFN